MQYRLFSTAILLMLSSCTYSGTGVDDRDAKKQPDAPRPAGSKTATKQDAVSKRNQPSKDAETRAPLKAVYVYADQKHAAKAYAKLLDQRQIETQVVYAADLSRELLANVDLIVVGSDTHRVWATELAVNLVAEANVPILAMGNGGYELFGELQLKIGKPHGETVTVTAIRPDKEAIFWDKFHREPNDGLHEGYSTGKQISIKTEGIK